MCLRKPSLLSLMPCTGFPCKAKHFFSVKALVETRWCFVHHCVWILWFPLRGLTGFSFANMLVFKPLLNYCMALFDSPFFLVIPLRRKKRRKGILYWNASFHLLGISLSVLGKCKYFWLLAEALNGPVLLCCRCLSTWSTDAASTCVHVELQDSSPLMLLVAGCVMQTISGCSGLALLGSVSRLCLLQCTLTWFVHWLLLFSHQSSRILKPLLRGWFI